MISEMGAFQEAEPRVCDDSEGDEFPARVHDHEKETCFVSISDRRVRDSHASS